MSHLRHVDPLVIAKRELVVVVNRSFMGERLWRRRESEGAPARRALAKAPTCTTNSGHAWYCAAIVGVVVWKLKNKISEQDTFGFKGFFFL